MTAKWLINMQKYLTKMCILRRYFIMAHSSQPISPNLLLNFDPYHILKPEKINPGCPVDRLIDIDDITINTEAVGSLSDQKTTYDLIDLVQNLYVTPNHVKRIDAIEIDSEDFFNGSDSNEKIDRVDTDNGIENKPPKVLVPKIDLNDIDKHLKLGVENRVTLNKSKVLNKKDIDSDSEDLIDEVLSEKTMEKIILKEMKETTINIEPSKEYPIFRNLKVLNTPDIDLQIPKQNTDEIKKLSKFRQTTSLIPETSNSRLNNHITNDLKTNKNKTMNLKEQEQINKIDFEVIAHKRNPKIFKKKCETKPVFETRNYTKGADFKEISTVLPHIMSRVSSRRIYLEQKEVNSRKKKYRREGNAVKEDFLDLKTMRLDGDKFVNVMKKDIECNPIILMADCNKERLKAFQQGKEFQKFVMGEKYG